MPKKERIQLNATEKMLRRKTYKNAKLNEGVRSTYQANNKIKKNMFYLPGQN